MKKKLFIIAAVILSSFTFTACEKEIILPNETIAGDSEGGDNGGSEDPGQWD